MSQLSQQKQNAGISRRALETINRTNGNGNGNHQTAHQPTTEVISAARKTPVIDTPYRELSILEMNSGRVVIRYTEWNESRAFVVNIPLEYHEAAALSIGLDHLEGDKSIVEATKGKPISRPTA